jgi:hypothetical protein
MRFSLRMCQERMDRAIELTVDKVRKEYGLRIVELESEAEQAADLLDQCEAAFQFIAQDDCECDECSKARQMLAAIRAVQEKNNE